MLNKIKLRHKIIAVIILLSFLLFQSCTKDDTIVESEIVPSLAAATIGNDGGILKTEDFELSVPVGAFLGANNLTLKLVENEDSGFDNIVSREFEIEGLPQSFSQPLTIKIKYSGELTDSSYIAIGENVWVSSLNQEIISYHFLSAIDSLGYITTKIAPIEDNNLSLGKSSSTENGDNLIRIHAASGEKIYMSSGKKFKIYYNSSVNESNVQNIAVYLETAYSTFESMGFQYDRRTLWPIEVYIERIISTKGEIYGLSTNALFNDINIFSNNRTYNTGYLKINSDKFSEIEEMKSSVGHEFFHLVQGLYDTRGVYAKAKTKAPNHWINEASSVWAEALFSDDSNKVSDVFIINADRAFAGAKLEKENPEEYGYGFASFIKYLTNKYADKILLKIYEEIFKGSNSFQAINSAIGTKVDLLWSEYLTKLFTYQLYKDKFLFSPVWLYSTAKSGNALFEIKNESDTSKTFSKKLTDLSAYIFAVKNSNDTVKANSDLNFELSGTTNNKILLFKQNKDESVFLEEGENSLIIENFKSITDAGYNIIAVVSNNRFNAPYTDVEDIILTIRVVKKELDPTPIITEIFDASTEYYFKEKRNFTVPGGEYIKIIGRNLKDVTKIIANGVVLEGYVIHSGDTLCSIRLPYFSELPNEHLGHVNIKVATTDSESNEVPYIIGQPINYISSSDSLQLELDFTVNYYTSQGELKTKRLNLEHGFLKNELNWNSNLVTIDLSTISDITGLVQCTFSGLENCEIDNVVLDYSEKEGDGGYNIHYEEANLNIGPEGIFHKRDNPHLSHTLVRNKIEKRYTTQPSISGVIRYYDSTEGEYLDAELNELDLTVDSNYRRFEISLIHFR